MTDSFGRESIIVCVMNSQAVAAALYYEAEEDLVFLGSTSTVTNLVIGFDPTVVATDLTAPTVTQNRKDILCYQASAGNQIQFPLNVPVSKGTRVYVIFGATKGTCLLYFAR